MAVIVAAFGEVVEGSPLNGSREDSGEDGTGELMSCRQGSIRPRDKRFAQVNFGGGREGVVRIEVASRGWIKGTRYGFEDGHCCFLSPIP